MKPRFTHTENRPLIEQVKAIKRRQREEASRSGFTVLHRGVYQGENA